MKEGWIDEWKARLGKLILNKQFLKLHKSLQRYLSRWLPTYVGKQHLVLPKQLRAMILKQLLKSDELVSIVYSYF